MGARTERSIQELNNECDIIKTILLIYAAVCKVWHISTIKHVIIIIEKFENNSVLKFTYEKEKAEKLSFLDCLVQKLEHAFKTTVYVKATHAGDCMNYKSICPDRYKVAVIRSLMHRAYNICSDGHELYLEIQRIKQLLTNNNFPANIIDESIEKFLTKRLDFSENNNGNNNDNISDQKPITFYFENQMTSNYKTDEKQLKNIIQKYIKPVVAEAPVTLVIYYRNRKLGNLIISNKPRGTRNLEDRHHVVYQYNCNLEGCQAPAYIGYTTCSLYDRFGMHTQRGSIKGHMVESHNILRTPRRDLLSCTKVIAANADRRKLIMTEAVLIKENKPSLNSQEEGCNRILKIFKH